MEKQGVKVDIPQEDDMFDFIVDNIIDDINAIRDQLTEKETVDDYDIERYLDALAGMMLELCNDHKLYVTLSTQTASVVKTIHKIIMGGKTIKISKEDKEVLGSMFS